MGRVGKPSDSSRISALDGRPPSAFLANAQPRRGRDPAHPLAPPPHDALGVSEAVTTRRTHTAAVRQSNWRTLTPPAKIGEERMSGSRGRALAAIASPSVIDGDILRAAAGRQRSDNETWD